MGSPVEEMLVGRMWRWDAATLESDARRDGLDREAAGVDVFQSVSVFALVRMLDESDEALEERLIELVKLHRRGKWLSLTTAETLVEAGFEVREDVPPDHHYAVLVCPDDQEELELLESVFSERDRRRVA